MTFGLEVAVSRIWNKIRLLEKDRPSFAPLSDIDDKVVELAELLPEQVGSARVQSRLQPVGELLALRVVVRLLPLGDNVIGD